ncbi:MAG: sulfotransferase, partial [Pseudomonadota bacterium]
MATALPLIVSLLAVAGFAVALWFGRILNVAQNALGEIAGGLTAITDKALDDDAKEAAVRRAGFALIKASFGILWRFALALAAAAVPIYLADALGLAIADAVFALMLRWDYILIVSVIAIILGEGIRRLKPASQATAKTATSPHQYSATDRAVHALAFANPMILKSLAGLEKRPANGGVAAKSPIFITSLARGGTTALLNALHSLPGIGSHTYRDMPFITAPGLWHRLSGGSRRQVARHERAHGDGLEIDLDTPEAFEEIIWKLFWPERFEGSTIPIWSLTDRNEKADAFLTRHMGHLVSARGAERYCSKNNGNIARLAYLRAAFPKAKIIVPIRRPDSHAASLWRQHQRFSKLQKDDDFIRRYMADIGHYDFGLLHKPLAFDGFESGRFDPDTPAYWLDYWCHAFRHVLRQDTDCLFIDQDKLRADPKAVMDRLLARLGIKADGADLSEYFLTAPDR